MKTLPIMQYNKLIETSYKILNINQPDTYYVEYTKAGFTLYDAHFHYISSDTRDVPFKITRFHYVEDENVFYININIFDDPTLAKVFALRETRRVYQYIQIHNK